MMKQQFFSLLTAIEQNAVLRDAFDEDRLVKFRTVAERVSYGAPRPFRVAFCGVFSSGKTSLINALLATDYQLPQGVNPVTKMITRIRPGEDVRCAYRLNGRETSVSNDYLSALIQGKKQLIFGSDELIVTMPSAMLPDGVEWLDTPGFNDDPSGALEQLSRRALYEADMAVLCCNCLQLGKIVERSLLADLDDWLGHYSLVMTRMDNLNEQADIDAVTAQANRLMDGRGNDAGIFGGVTGMVFPVTAAGSMRYLGALEGYLRAIMTDSDVRRQIREASDGKLLAHCVAEMAPAVEAFETERRAAQEAEARRRAEEARRQRVREEAERSRRALLAQEARRVAEGFAQAREQRFAADIRCIPNAGVYGTEAAGMARALAEGLIEDLAQYSRRVGLADDAFVRQSLWQEYRQRGFVVPPPCRIRVRKRGFAGRLVRTLLNFVTFRFTIDDGCEDGYADWCAPAVEAVRGGIIMPLLSRYERIVNHE